MPKSPWPGYGRFCPLARALDVVGERWTLVIVQELLNRSRRYGELLARLPGSAPVCWPSGCAPWNEPVSCAGIPGRSVAVSATR